MLERLGSDDLVEWMAWERLTGPLGKTRLDYLIAEVCLVMTQCWTTSKGKPPKLEDFLLFKPPQEQVRLSPKEFAARLRASIMAMARKEPARG